MLTEVKESMPVLKGDIFATVVSVITLKDYYSPRHHWSKNLFLGHAHEEIFGPERDFWTSGVGDHFQRRRRSDQAGERHDLWSIGRHLDQGHHARASFRERDQSGRGLDQYLQHVQRSVSLWWLQAVRLRPRDGQARA